MIEVNELQNYIISNKKDTIHKNWKLAQRHDVKITEITES